MKLLKIHTMGILTGALLFMPGCDKFLDKKSNTTLAVPASLEELQGLLDDADLMNNQVTPSYGEACSDDYFLPAAAYDALRQDWKQTYLWIPYDYYAPNDWSTSYLPVYNANYCLEALDKIVVNSSNQELFNQVKGGAYFFRAHSLLNLLWIHGKAYVEGSAVTDPGVPLRQSSDFNEPSVRAAIKDGYELVISNAMAAAGLLPALPLHPMRPSRCAAFGLLARTYLSMNRYDSAYKYANLALLIKDTLLDYNDPAVTISANVPFKPFNPEIIFFSSMNNYNRSHETTRALIDTVLVAAYENNDLRKKVFFRAASGYQRFKGSYASNATRLFTGIATDELLLMRAECSARTGDIQGALADVNKLRQKRWDKNYSYIPLQATMASEVQNIVMSERRKELLMRGLRWMDLKRLNAAGGGITLYRKINGALYTLAPNDNRYAILIPRDIIEQTGMQQNPQ